MLLAKQSITQFTLTIMCAAVLAGCGEGGGTGGGGSKPSMPSTSTLGAIQNPKILNSQAEAISLPTLMRHIELLPEAEHLTAKDVGNIKSTFAAYAQLSDTEKMKVPQAFRDKLTVITDAILKNKNSVQMIKDAIDALPGDSNVNEAKLREIVTNYKALTDNQKTLLNNKILNKLDALIVDNKSLPDLNLPMPLHTAFISSKGAQQHNPHMQLRDVDGPVANGALALVDTQIGLIKSLVVNQNAPLVIDTGTATNTGGSGATQIVFPEQNAAIAKSSSTATSVHKSNTDAEWKKYEEDLKVLRRPYEEYYDLTLIDRDIAGLILQVAQDRDDYAKETSAWISVNSAFNRVIEANYFLENFYHNLIEPAPEWDNGLTEVIHDIAYIKKDKQGLAFDKAFDGVYVVNFDGGPQMVLHDPAAAGWTYQTFAHYIDKENGVVHGYQSIGDETARIAMPTAGTATYTGITTAHLVSGDKSQQVTANVNAVANFAKKGLRFNTSNSQTHVMTVDKDETGYGSDKYVRLSTAAPNLNLKGNAAWNANINMFKGNVSTTDNQMKGTLNGKFFGTGAAEIGGTYGLKNSANNAQLIGGYGAKRGSKTLSNRLDVNAVFIDNKSLPELNLPTPMHTAFISSKGAQQHNPHTQLRDVDGRVANGALALVDTQIGLIKSLVVNPNAPVVIDTGVATNTGGSGATQVTFAEQNTAIAKSSSTATSIPVLKYKSTDEKDREERKKATIKDQMISAEKNFDYYHSLFLSAERDYNNTQTPEALTDLKSAAAERAFALDKLEIITEYYYSVPWMSQLLLKDIDNIAYIKKDAKGLVFDKAFDGVYAVHIDGGPSIVLHDPGAAGWTYQTFAHYIDLRNGVVHGYQSIGDETAAAAVPAAGTATYTGITTAHLVKDDKSQQVTANVNAVANFAKKGLSFNTSNSQTHATTVVTGDPNGFMYGQTVRVSKAAPNLNLKGSATWNANSNMFKGNVKTTNNKMKGTLDGKFFGVGATEIGGTYGLKNKANNTQLIGGYGAKRK